MAAYGSDPQQLAGRRVRLSLLLSGLRWRARSSIVMFVVAAFGAGVGAFGPMYLHSTDQVVLNQTLRDATPGNAGLTLVAVKGHGAVAPLVASVGGAPRSGSASAWFGTPIVTQLAGFTTIPATKPLRTAGASTPRSYTTGIYTERKTPIPYSGTRPFVGSVVSRTGVCHHLSLIKGTCSRGENGVMISTRTAQALGLGLGSVLHVVFNGSTRGAPLVVVGVYTPNSPALPYWWGESYFPYGTYSPANFEEIDDVFATAAGVREMVPASHISPLVQVPFNARSLTVGGVGGFEGSLAAFQQAELGRGIRVATHLFDLLAQAGEVEHTSTTIVVVVGLQLVLLAVFVLYFVASRTSAEREPDVRLAELRGFRPRSTIAVALAEPVAIVAVAVPVGFFAAWLAAALSAPSIFGAGIGASPTVPALYAAVAAGAVGVLAAALGTRRSIVVGVDPTSGAAVAPRSRSRWAPVADIAIVAIAGAAFFELVAVGDSGANSVSASDPLAAFAPGLLAVALGVLAARGLPRVLRATLPRTAHSSNVPVVLATRLVARRREFAAQLVLVSVAVGLAVFAVSGWSIAGTNRDIRAQFGIGAPKVLTVTVRQGTTFLSAVRAADPTGRYAMAAVVEQAPDGTTLALDAARMPTVVTWPHNMGIGIRQLAHRLTSTSVAPLVTVRGGTAVRVTVDTTANAVPAPQLSMDLFNEATQTPEQVTFGPLQSGTHTYGGTLSFLCTGGCRLTDLALGWAPTSSLSGASSSGASVSLDVEAIAEQGPSGRWTPLRASLHDAARWMSPSGGVRLAGSANGLAGRFKLDSFGAPVTIAPADVPRALPVVVTPTSASLASGDGGPLVVGLDGGTISGHTVGRVPALPGVGPDAVLSNLATADLFLAGPFESDFPEVWLSSTAPPGIVHALRAHGVVVTGTETVAAQERALAHSGVSLAYLLYLVSAAAAGVLVVGATAFVVVSGARRRETELAALRAVGVDARALRRSVWTEQALVLGTGVVAGAAAGMVAALVALRSVPEFVGHSTGPPLVLGLPPLVLAVSIGGLLLALGATVVLGASAVVRGATVDRLGAGQ